MNQPISFIPAGKVTVQTACSPLPGTFPMPAVDGANLDTQVTAGGAATVYVAFGTGATAGSKGCLVVKPGQSALLTMNNAAIAAAAASGRVLAQCEATQGDAYGTGAAPLAQAAAASGATTCSVVTSPPGATVTITRGTASLGTTF